METASTFDSWFTETLRILDILTRRYRSLTHVDDIRQEAAIEVLRWKRDWEAEGRLKPKWTPGSSAKFAWGHAVRKVSGGVKTARLPVIWGADDLMLATVPAGTSDPAEDASEREMRSKVAEWMAKLPREDAELLRLVYFEGKSRTQLTKELHTRWDVLERRIADALARVAVIRQQSDARRSRPPRLGLREWLDRAIEILAVIHANYRKPSAYQLSADVADERLAEGNVLLWEWFRKFEKERRRVAPWTPSTGAQFAWGRATKIQEAAHRPLPLKPEVPSYSSPTPLEQTHQLLLHDRLVEQMALLTPRQASIVDHYFFKGQTSPEIARELGVSKQMVSKTLQRALAELREAPDVQRLEETLEGSMHQSVNGEFDPEWTPPEQEQITQRGTNLGFGARLTTIDHLGNPLPSGTQVTSEWLPRPRQRGDVPRMTQGERRQEIRNSDPYVLLLGGANLVREALLNADAHYQEHSQHRSEVEPWIRMGSMLLDRAVDLILHRFYRRALCRIIELERDMHADHERRVPQIAYAVRPMMSQLARDSRATLDALHGEGAVRSNDHDVDVVDMANTTTWHGTRAYSALMALVRAMERFLLPDREPAYIQIDMVLVRTAEVTTGVSYIPRFSTSRNKARNAALNAVNAYWQAIKTRYPVMVDPYKGETIACQVLEEDAAVGYDPNDPKWQKRRETPAQRHHRLQQERAAERRRLLDMMESGDTTEGPDSIGRFSMSREKEIRQFLDQLPQTIERQAAERVVRTLEQLSDEQLSVVLGLIQYQADSHTEDGRNSLDQQHALGLGRNLRRPEF